MATQTPKPISFCVVCDAVDGDCGHQAARYLQDIVYEPGPQGGWSAEHERARWDAAPLRVLAQPKTEPQARDVEDLVDDLAESVYLDQQLEARFRTTHALDPLRTSRLAAATIEGAMRGSLTNPGGFLAKRLAEIEHGKTKAP